MPLLLAVSMGGTFFAWNSIESTALFLCAACMAVIFIFREQRTDSPLISPAFFKDRAIGISFAIAFFSQAVMFSIIMYLPYFIQGVIGSTATTSGAVITPMMLGLLAASNLTGQTISRIGKAHFLSIFAFIIMGLGAYLLSSMDIHTPYAETIIYTILIGFGVGMSMPITNVNAQNAAPHRQIASVTSSVMFSRNMGGTVGSAVYGVVMTKSLQRGFASVDMHNLPSRVSEMLSNVRILTDAKAVAAIRIHVPVQYIGVFNKIYSQAESVLVSSINSVFLCCLIITVLGLVSALFLREVPVQKKNFPQPVKETVSCSGGNAET